MITVKQRIALLANWGEPAENLNCNAEVRLYDPLSKWECFLIAMDPFEQDSVYAIVNSANEIAALWSLTYLMQCYNAEGEHPLVDKEFRPRNAGLLLKQLMERRGESYRN